MGVEGPVITETPGASNGVSTGQTESLYKRLRKFTPRLAFMMFFLSISAFNFGYDQGNFSGLQALNSFQRRFGQYDEKSDGYRLPSYLQSLMTSTPYLGKLLGTWTCSPLMERLGRKKMMGIIIVLSYIGVALEISAASPAQFTVGRIVCFYMAGFTVQVVPIYLAECAPPDLRGLIGSQVQFQINFSIMVAAIVNLGASHVSSPIQWRITVMVQFLMPTVMACCYPFVVESPRWLIGKGYKDLAVKSLQKLRKKDVSIETIEEEVTYLSSLGNNEGKGNWKEVFPGVNRRRTGIACFVMFGQQITGQVFASQYGTIFYKTQGISNPFLMQMISTVVGLCCMFCTALIIDGLGRRFVLLSGGIGQAGFMLALGGVGLVKSPNNHVKNLMVAFLILDGTSYNISWAPLSYLTVSEVSNYRVREKAAMLAVSVSIITVFITSFTLPYLMNADYAGLGPKVGFIYGSFATVMVSAAYFILPELKGRSLDEIDELFERRLAALAFKKATVESTRFEEGATPAGPAKQIETGVSVQQVEGSSSRA